MTNPRWMTARPRAAEQPFVSVAPVVTRSAPAGREQDVSAVRAHPGRPAVVHDQPELTVGALVDAAARFEIETVTDAVHASVSTNGVVWTWEKLIHPAWSTLGGGRNDADRSVAVERLFSRAMLEVLTANPQPPHGASVQILLACAVQEHTTLPLEALAAALGEVGLPTCVLGGCVPTHALTAAVGRVRPGVIVVWSQMPDTADPREISALRGLCSGPPAIIAAGPGWHRAPPSAQAPSSSSLSAVLGTVMALAEVGA